MGMCVRIIKLIIQLGGHTMNKGYMEAIEALGEMLLQHKNELRYKEYELEAAKQELEELKAKIKAVEEHIDSYVENVS